MDQNLRPQQGTDGIESMRVLPVLHHHQNHRMKVRVRVLPVYLGFLAKVVEAFMRLFWWFKTLTGS